MEYLTTVEMSEVWNISSRRIGVLCADGRIEGVIKKAKAKIVHVIPGGAVCKIVEKKKEEGDIDENKDA